MKISFLLVRFFFFLFHLKLFDSSSFINFENFHYIFNYHVDRRKPDSFSLKRTRRQCQDDIVHGGSSEIGSISVGIIYQEQYRYYSHQSRRLDWRIPSCSRDDWHDCAPFLFSPDINYAFVSSSGETSSNERTVPGQRRLRRRRRWGPRATVKNDGTLRREETRAFIVFAIRTVLARFHDSSLFFPSLLLRTPHSVTRSCLQYFPSNIY